MMQFRQSAHSTSIVASLLSISIIFACSGRTAAQTWRIDTQFVGIAYGNPQSMSSGPTVVENIFSSSYSSMAASPDGREISSVTNSPPTSSGGGLTSIIRARSTALKGNNGSINADHTLTGGLIHNTMYWLGDSQYAPTEVKVIFRRKVTVTVMAFGGESTGASGAAMASASCGVSLNCQIASTGAEVHDSRSETTLFYEQILSVTNGQTSFSFPMSWSLASSAGAGTSGVGKGEATCEIVTDFIIAGMTFGRHPGSGLEAVGAGHSQGQTDPTYTRWLPLSFSPIVNSQPFRQQAGGLSPPWGNVNCAYSIRVHREDPLFLNWDSFGSALFFLPGPGYDGTYNNPRSPGTPRGLTRPFVPDFVITDATGERILVGNGDLKSDFSGGAGGVTILNAGPPGAIKERGRFTYVFGPLTGTPQTGRLLSISDDLGNTQWLTWGASSMTVLDSSSGRSLIFNGSPSSYFTSVDAPAVGGGVAMRTTLQFDGAGHLMQRQVFLGTGGVPVATDAYGYGSYGPGGSVPDALASSTAGGVTATYQWEADPWAKDPFGNPFPRLKQARFGSMMDMSSSDDGGLILGTYDFSFGRIRTGFSKWDLDSRTNIITNARGYQAQVSYGLRWPVDANTIQGDIKSLRVKDFLGRGFDYLFTPNITAPTRIDLYEPGGANWWVALSQGLVTQFTDPNLHSWNMGWTPTGQLSSYSDPTGISWTLNHGEGGAAPSKLTSIVDPGATRRLEINYNGFGQPTLLTLPAAASATGQNEQSSFTYHPTTGDLTQIQNPLGFKATVNAYDALGDPLSFSVFPDTGDPATSLTPLTALMDWNPLQDLLWARFPNLAELQNTWVEGNLTRAQVKAPAAAGGAVLRQTDLTYDTRGRMHRAVDLVGTVAELKFDKDSNPTRVKDGRQKTTALSYDPNSWLGSITPLCQYDLRQSIVS